MVIKSVVHVNLNFTVLCGKEVILKYILFLKITFFVVRLQKGKRTTIHTTLFPP